MNYENGWTIYIMVVCIVTNNNLHKRMKGEDFAMSNIMNDAFDTKIITRNILLLSWSMRQLKR